MKRRLVSVLRKSPKFFEFVNHIYYSLQPIHIKEMLIGAEAQERAWSTRHLHKGNAWNYTNHQGEADEWVKGYWDSRNHPHRAFLVDRIASYNPKTILEVGCNCAPNLYLLAKRCPDARIFGIDINPIAIERGKEFLAKDGITNVFLNVWNVRELWSEHDQYYDVVFTDAVLIYILPEDIIGTMENLVRINNKSLIMLERHLFDSRHDGKDALGVYRYGCWERDYFSLLRRFVSDEQIKITKITKDIWDEERWQKVGALIEVRK